MTQIRHYTSFGFMYMTTSTWLNSLRWMSTPCKGIVNTEKQQERTWCASGTSMYAFSWMWFNKWSKYVPHSPLNFALNTNRFHFLFIEFCWTHPEDGTALCSLGQTALNLYMSNCVLLANSSPTMILALVFKQISSMVFQPETEQDWHSLASQDGLPW